MEKARNGCCGQYGVTTLIGVGLRCQGSHALLAARRVCNISSENATAAIKRIDRCHCTTSRTLLVSVTRTLELECFKKAEAEVTPPPIFEYMVLLSNTPPFVARLVA